MLKAWDKLLQDICTPQMLSRLTRMSKRIFLQSRLVCINEKTMAERALQGYLGLQFFEFFEALCRVACFLKPTPLAQQWAIASNSSSTANNDGSNMHPLEELEASSPTAGVAGTSAAADAESNALKARDVPDEAYQDKPMTHLHLESLLDLMAYKIKCLNGGSVQKTTPGRLHTQLGGQGVYAG